MQTVVRTSLTAITRKPSRQMQGGERAFVGREVINPVRAIAQHGAYCKALASCGFKVQTLAAEDSLPDCAFVEDCAVALPESALLCRPGVASRAPEVAAVASELSKLRRVIRSGAPATLEGGDVLRYGTTILVGRSSRTNVEGITTLRRWAEPLGYTVIECRVHGCLHLKTACTFLPGGSLLANTDWVELPRSFEIVDICKDEPFAGNILLAGEKIIAAGSQARTSLMLRDRGLDLLEVDISEFQKAEGGVTCLSILLGAD